MLDGKSVTNPPDSIMMYELCKTFGKLPDEIDRQDNLIMQEIIIIHNTIGEHEAKEGRKQKRDALKKSHGGGGR